MVFQRSLLLIVACAALAAGQVIDLERPDERAFVLDQAGLLSVEDARQIRAYADQLLTEKAIPIIVVTIRSMAEHTRQPLGIERFASLLFDQWAIGVKEINGAEWNRGILLLVSQGDRKARIELGAGWGRREDGRCREIMDGHIIPAFKAGDFTGGILAGVTALDALARGEQLPTRPWPWWHYLLVVGLALLTLFTIVSLVRRGSGGWAWLFWAAVFGLLWYLLIAFLRSSGRSSGGGFSGGSFGGGFSGGGGATGSW